MEELHQSACTTGILPTLHHLMERQVTPFCVTMMHMPPYFRCKNDVQRTNLPNLNHTYTYLCTAPNYISSTSKFGAPATNTHLYNQPTFALLLTTHAYQPSFALLQIISHQHQHLRAPATNTSRATTACSVRSMNYREITD